MQQVELLIQELIAAMHAAAPQPHLWSGSAARAAHAEIETAIEELQVLRANLLRLPNWLG
jgi:hypothetical protein